MTKYDELKAYEVKNPNWSHAQQRTGFIGATDVNSIITALLKHGGFIDDHRASKEIINESNSNCTGYLLCVMNNGYTCISPRWERDFFSVNPLYVDDDGIAHLSTCSVGGTCTGSLERYNQEYSVENLKARGCTWIIPSSLSPIHF